MKKLYLPLLAILFFACTHTQSQTQNQTKELLKKGKPFFVGLSYAYMSFDMKLKDLSLHTIWTGQDMGTHEFSTEDLDEINSFAERSSTVNAICIEAGMPL